MTFIGQIELTKKKPPKVNGDERAWQDLYDTLNHLIDAVNSKKTTEVRRPGNLQGSVGDLKVFKDKTDGKYYLEAMTEDGSARRELAITDKDVRTGKGYYSTSGIPGEGGTGGSEDSRNVEQQLFEAIPWTNGTPNNVVTNSDGVLVVDNVPGETVSNNNITEANIVGSGKTFAAGQKPNKIEIDSDGKFVSDGTTSSTVISNGKIAVADVVGTGKSFTSNPLTAAVAAQSTADSALSTANGKNKSFYQDAVPSSGVKEGDMWFDTNDDNKMYRAAADNSDAVTSGEWELVNAIPSLAAISISASNINAGAVTSGKINVASLSAISANMGSITAGDINVGSGKFVLESDGDATFSDGRFFFDKAGDFYIKPSAADASGNTRRGLVYTEYLDGSGNWSDYWMQYHDSGTATDTNQMNWLYNGSNKFELSTAGRGSFAGGIRFGDVTNNDVGFDQDGGNSISVQMNVNGSSMMPAVHGSSTTVGYDLGKSTQKWRKIFVVQSNVGDLVMDNQDDARWILREQPDCILARNCKTQKTFKLNMTETSDYNDEVWEDEQTT